LDPLFVHQYKCEDGANAASHHQSSTGDHYLLKSFEPGIDLLIPQGTNRLMGIQSGLIFIHNTPKLDNFRAILGF
jgi:hypothetical protein